MPEMRRNTYRVHAVKRGRTHRFAKWCEQEFNIPWQTIYTKIRSRRIKLWEMNGITSCIQEFGFQGSPNELWGNCVKNQFCDFMNDKQMSRMTVWRRFSANDFTKIEMDGFRRTYTFWVERIESKNK